MPRAISSPRASSVGTATGSLLVESAQTSPTAKDEPTCRLCWSEADPNIWGGELLSPCKCSGSLKFIHRRCLGGERPRRRFAALALRRTALARRCRTLPLSPADSSRAQIP
jgi:hypothetical protein